jgi:hypothetical protein
MSAVLVLLPPDFQPHDPVCVDYGLSAIKSSVTGNLETAETLLWMLLSVSSALLEIGNRSVTKDRLHLLLSSVPNLPVAFVATISDMIANTASPEIVSLGCRIFLKQ